MATSKLRLQHVYNVLRGKGLDTGDVSAERRAAQFERLRPALDEVVNLTNWHEFLKYLAHASFRSARMIASENTVIYTYVIWLLGKRDFGMDVRSPGDLIAR